MKTIPEDFERVPVDVMSNADHTVAPNAADLLKGEKIAGDYAGWNFHGSVWFDRETQHFACEVRVYHQHVATLEADTLEELMELVSDEYGHD